MKYAKRLRKFKNRTYKNIFLGLIRPNSPSYLILYVNNICQMRCKMCFYWDSLRKKTEQLSLDEIEKIASGFSNLLQLTLTGGEPSLREDLSEIPRIFSKKSNLAKCTIVTNGMLYKRIYDQAVEMVRENPEVDFRFAVSIDGIGEDHDKIRGVKGSYENLVKTLELLCELREKVHNLWVDVTTVITRYNHHKIHHIYNHLRKHFKVDNHVFPYVRGNVREKDSKDLPSKSYSEIKDIFKQDTFERSKHFFQIPTSVIRELVNDEVEREILTRTYRYNCSAGKKFIEIYPDGRVVPCEILETLISPGEAVMGNVKDFNFDIRKLLKSKKAKKIINYIHNSKCHCTFECPKHMDVMYNAKFYSKILKGLTKQHLRLS